MAVNEMEILVIDFASDRISIIQTSSVNAQRQFGIRFEYFAIQMPQRDNATVHSWYSTLDEALLCLGVELVYGDRVWTHLDYRSQIEGARLFELLYNSSAVESAPNTTEDVEFSWDDCPSVGPPCN
jgi:hypothetical protein